MFNTVGVAVIGEAFCHPCRQADAPVDLAQQDSLSNACSTLASFVPYVVDSYRVDWFNNRRLFEPIGNVSPAEFEMAYYLQLEGRPWWFDSNKRVS